MIPTNDTARRDSTGWNDSAHARVSIGSRVYGGYVGERFQRGDRSNRQGEPEITASGTAEYTMHFRASTPSPVPGLSCPAAALPHYAQLQIVGTAVE